MTQYVVMKGIILAGGTGSRLHPITQGISKQLTPVYDKPMIYYPLSTLMLAGIRDILIITTPADQEQFKRLLGDGSRFGINLEYKVQPSPDGLAQAFILGADFIGNDPVALVLGDNIFYGPGLGTQLATYEVLPRGTAWLDTGTFDSLADATNFIRTVQSRQGLSVGCPEEIAWRHGWLSDEQLREIATPLVKSGYGSYLLGLLR